MHRRHFWTRQVAVAVLIAMVAAVPAAGGKPKHSHRDARPDSPMTNYGVVWDHKLTRSGMPSNGSGWRWLREQGIRSIVTFRGENDVDYARYGFSHVMNLPLSSRVFPTEQQAEAFLDFVQDPNNQPVHIHCQAGKDRTGMMAALVRYAVDGWGLDKALAEARVYRGAALGKQRIEWLRNWANRHPPGSARRAGGPRLEG